MQKGPSETTGLECVFKAAEGLLITTQRGTRVTILAQLDVFRI